MLMTENQVNIKAKIASILLLFALVFCNVGMPITVYAAGGTTTTTTTTDKKIAGDVSDIDIKMKDGKLNLNGLEQDNESAWNSVYEKYRDFITGVSGIGAITMVVLFILQFMKLGASAGNPSARSQALSGVLWTGLAAAGLGAVTIITAFFYKAI